MSQKQMAEQQPNAKANKRTAAENNLLWRKWFTIVITICHFDFSCYAKNFQQRWNIAFI